MTAKLEITHKESWKATVFRRMTRYNVEASGKVLGYIIEERMLGVVTNRFTSEDFHLTKAQMKQLIDDHQARA